MSKQFFFTSGLPRAGSTLLAAILNQNPRFQASISGPLARFSRAIIDQSSAQGGYRHQCPEEKRKAIIKNMFDTYYDAPGKEVFFDHNRGWNLLLPLVKDLYPYTKTIVCVRDIPWILDSFENLVRKNPYSLNGIFPEQANINVYTRSRYLMDEGSTVGFAYNALKHAITSNEKNMLMLVEYDQLCTQPEQTMNAIYKFIDQPVFAHDFDNVESSYDEFDNDVNLKGLHTTRKKVQLLQRDMIIPPDIIQQYSGYEVWR
jgi:sulfotransferase